MRRALEMGKHGRGPEGLEDAVKRRLLPKKRTEVDDQKMSSFLSN